MVKLHLHLQELLFLYTVFCILDYSNPLKASAEPTYLVGACPKEPPLTPNSTYRDNLNALFPLLVSKAATSLTGFYQTSAGAEPTEIAYGLFLCRGDLSTEACGNCVFTATKEVPNRCESMDGTFWLDQCMLRHSYNKNFTVLDQNVYYKNTTTSEKVADPDRLERVLGDTLKGLAKRASNGGPGKKFAAGEAEYSDTEKFYGLAQCTPDLTPEECNYCLLDGISKLPICCANARGAMVLFFSCGIRYEFFPFYNTTAVPSPPALPPRPQPPPAIQPRTPPAGEKKAGISTQVLVTVIVAVCVFVLLFVVAGSCFLSRKAKKKRNYDFIIQEDSKKAGHDITMEHSLQYDLVTIQAATNNFSPENKIGQGGYGPVYKGILSNGEEIAVKRLSRGSGQGEAEFKNEVVVVAKLQHKNLVRLLGFCLEAEEKILIYEFVPNKSLDYLLFDPRESAKLDWSIRYKIIAGIVRGMLYLHEDSRPRVIHRDLKAANILLDGAMNVKISDFGMAKIFGVDQTHGSTKRVVGTFGYMSPEYFGGVFSVKSDAFSFGVLILEIISGKKNDSRFDLFDCDNLTSYAWKLWDEGRPLDLIDRVLKVSYSESEVTRCIHIGLLCVQDDPNSRPSMENVVLMLTNYSITLPVAQKPAYIALSETGSTKPNTTTDTDQLTTQSIPFSVNEASVTDVYPR